MSKVTLSYDGIGEMLRSDFMVAEMERRAEKVLTVAESTAPVDEAGPHPGRYKGAFSIASTKQGGTRHNRAEARVINDAPEAPYVEYGTRTTPKHATLRRALEHATD